VDVEYVSKPWLGELLSEDGVQRLTLGEGSGAAVFVCGGIFLAIEFLNIDGLEELVVGVCVVCMYGLWFCKLTEYVVNGT
jgi:hypothetical protein